MKIFLTTAILTVSLLGCGDSDTGSSDTETPEGRWRVERTATLDEQIRALEGVGYVSGSRPAPDRLGITVHDRDRTAAGFNLYTSGHSPVAILMDMAGNQLHSWSCSFDTALPNFPLPDELEKSHFRQYFRRCHLFDNGDLLAIFEGHALVKLDHDSNVLWTFDGKPHHDLQVMENGEIYVLTRTAHVVERIHPTRPVLEDFISVLDRDGVERTRFSVLECFERSRFAGSLARMPREGDLLHTNTIEVLDGRLADRVPAFRKGNLLISCLKTSTLAVIDPATTRVVWTATGTWVRQHQPTVLDSGRLMLFDNLGNNSPFGKSRVLELEPQSLNILWELEGNEESLFQTNTCGSCQRLPNGNTLITESDNGRAFEVTRDREIVWEFVSPHRAGKNNRLIATLFEVIRLPEDFPMEWLD